VILADTERVAVGIAKGICLAFDVPYYPVSTPTTGVPEECTACKDKDALIQKVKDILYGKGWIWQKINNLKKLITK
jgi:hypothetical protein